MAMFGRATRNDVLRSYTPTMAERIPIAVQGFLGRLGLNKYQARSFGQPIADVLGYSPVGAVAQSWDAGQAAARAPGMFGKAAGLGGGMALAALGAVPGGKALARKGEALAMDEASRMARAAEQGFTVDAYHGTTSNFDAFDPSLTRDIGMHFGTQGQANKITNDFRGFTEPNANVMPVKLALNNPLRVKDEFDRYGRRHVGIAKSITLDTPGFMANAEEREAIYAAARNADKLKAKARKKYAVIPMSEDVGEQAFWREVQKSAERQGYDGMVYANKIEGKGDSHIVFDPANIRSKFAAFDPAKRGSANLLAGLGVGAMVAPSMFGNRGGER